MSRDSLKTIGKLLDRAKDRLTIEQSFLMDLKRSIELSDEKESRKPSQTYKPSSMNCIRNMWYQITGKEPDESNSNYTLIGICNSGTDIHIRMQVAIEHMKENGFDCEYIPVDEFVRLRRLNDLQIVGVSGMETKLYHKKLNMSFLCDGIIRYLGHYYILELKTETSYKWGNRKGVDESHYMQATAYSIAFNLPEILFVYINRDVLDMKAFMFIPTDEMKYELIGNIEECDAYVSKLVCPPIPENLPKKVCNYCSYHNSCMKEC